MARVFYYGETVLWFLWEDVTESLGESLYENFM